MSDWADDVAEKIVDRIKGIEFKMNLPNAYELAALIRQSPEVAGLVGAISWIAKRYDSQKSVLECSQDAYEMHCIASSALSKFNVKKVEDSNGKE